MTVINSMIGATEDETLFKYWVRWSPHDTTPLYLDDYADENKKIYTGNELKADVLVSAPDPVVIGEEVNNIRTVFNAGTPDLDLVNDILTGLSASDNVSEIMVGFNYAEHLTPAWRQPDGHFTTDTAPTLYGLANGDRYIWIAPVFLRSY